MSWIWNGLVSLWDYVLNPAFFLSPIYIPSTVLIAYLAWKVSKSEQGFLAYLMPKHLYLHPSSWVDIKVTFCNLLFFSSSLMAALYLAPAWASELLAVLNTIWGDAATPETSLVQGIVAVLVLFLAEDFSRYLTHRIHHSSSVLWPFHAVHHSAEVLTPLTFYRGHPFYYVFQRLLMAVVVGTIQALLVFILLGTIDPWVFYASALVFQGYVYLGAHLRHSHIPIRYGKVLEHILISPAQHQIHHSTDPRHYNKNLGEVFALWDWFFGTLYIPQGDEKLNFGLGDEQGMPIPQPYPTLRAAFARPFIESACAARGVVKSFWGRMKSMPVKGQS